MLFVEFPPSSALSPFAERLWVLRIDEDATPELSPVLPDGHVELVVHLGTPFSEVQAEAAGGLLKVEDLAAAAGVSARQIERLFAHHVGLSPKAFLRILRLLRRLRQGHRQQDQLL